MSDITQDDLHPTTAESGIPPGLHPTTAESGIPPGLRASSTLDALQELVEVAGAVGPAVARRAGLSVSELHSLRHLMAGPLGPVDLARLLGVTTAASSGVVDRLVSSGHAQRRPHRTDGRRTEVSITESGRSEVYARLAPMFRGLAANDADLTDNERLIVDRYLRAATEAMRTLL